jgi:hypothetical protein
MFVGGQISGAAVEVFEKVRVSLEQGCSGSLRGSHHRMQSLPQQVRGGPAAAPRTLAQKIFFCFGHFDGKRFSDH